MTRIASAVFRKQQEEKNIIFLATFHFSLAHPSSSQHNTAQQGLTRCLSIYISVILYFCFCFQIVAKFELNGDMLWFTRVWCPLFAHRPGSALLLHNASALSLSLLLPVRGRANRTAWAPSCCQTRVMITCLMILVIPFVFSVLNSLPACLCVIVVMRAWACAKVNVVGLCISVSPCSPFFSSSPSFSSGCLPP